MIIRSFITAATTYSVLLHFIILDARPNSWSMTLDVHPACCVQDPQTTNKDGVLTSTTQTAKMLTPFAAVAGGIKEVLTVQVIVKPACAWT
jgi:hypothetical protein